MSTRRKRHASRSFCNCNILAKPSLGSVIASGWYLHTQRELFDTTIAVLHVGKDLSKKTFRIHKGLLCDASPVFKAELEGSFKEAVEQTIDLPEEDVTVFDMFMLWIYGGSLLEKEESAKSFTQKTVINIYVFAEARHMPGLQNAAIDLLIDQMVASNQVEIENVKYIYENTWVTSPLRKLYVAVFAGCGQASWLTDYYKPYLPQDFMFDLSIAFYGLTTVDRTLQQFKTSRKDSHVTIPK